MFAVGVNQKIHRSVRMALSFSGLYEPGLIGLCNPMEIAREYGIISYKKVNILKTTKGQHAKRFPLWRERGNDDKGLSSLAVSP